MKKVREIKFKSVTKWQKENILKGFEFKTLSNKYEKVTSQVNETEDIVLIRVAKSNLKYVENLIKGIQSYVVEDDITDENGENKIFGQKWFKKFNVLDNTWYSNEYLVVFNKNYYQGDFQKLIEIAKEQENYLVEINEEEE